MLRAMFSGVSALKAHQLRLDVIGDNMANVLTVGYKASNTVFKNIYSQNLKGASSSTESRGGTNPMQVGLGAGISSITVNHKRGSVERTEVPSHLMVDGDGYFVVSSDAKGLNRFYTRAGNFEIDELGFMVTPEGFKVLDENMKPIQINMSDVKSASPTKYITMTGNLNSSGEDYTMTVDLYDSLGDVHPINLDFRGKSLTTDSKITIDAKDPGKYEASVTDANYSFREFRIRDEKGNQIVPEVSGGEVWYTMFNDHGEVVDLVKLNTPGDANGGYSPVDANLVMKVPGAADISVPINRKMFFANADDDPVRGVRIFTSVSKESLAKGVQLYGNAAGQLRSYQISSKGEVTGKYTNGEEKILHVVGLAAFDNPPGLLKVGNNLFDTTPNSGDAKFGAPGTGSFGDVLSGAIEMSNVDMAAQFTDLIMTQRGLQANSRIITTSDEILQELVNLKR